MKKLPKNLWKIIIGCLILGVVIPLLINWLYSIPAPIPFLAMHWEAADVLGFYGSMLGAAATIFVLQQTIEFTRGSQREERKLSIKPRLETKLSEFSKPLLSLKDEQYFFVHLDRDMIVSSEVLPQRIEHMIYLNNQIKDADDENLSDDHHLNVATLALSQETFLQQNCIVLYEIYNYGAANAIDVKFLVNDDQVCPHFCISTTQPKRIIIIVHESRLINGRKDIDISLQYTDIGSIGIYEQSEQFVISKNNDRFNTIQFSKGLLTSPKELTKKDGTNG